MKYTKKNEILGLPSNFRFGVEIEAFNVKTKGKNSLYTGKSSKFIKSKHWHMATKHEESLVGKGGAELVSPILTDDSKSWESIEQICNHIKKYPGNKGNKVVADEKCGLHVHFDTNCLTKNPLIMENFLKIYAESEELLYKMCNDKNDPIRNKAINKDFKGLRLISSIWRNGMASPSGKKIMKQIENNTLKVSYKKFNRLKLLISKYKLDERRYHGLNLTNIGNPNKNTIEFRMSNGTLNPDIIKQNIFLYASLINKAIQITENPLEFEDRLSNFYKTNISEQEKANYFLELIIDDPEDRKIYIDRWMSVKDEKVFEKNHKKGFAQDRFTREQFKNIATRTPSISVSKMYSYISNTIQKTKNKEEIFYDRY